MSWIHCSIKEWLGTKVLKGSTMMQCIEEMHVIREWVYIGFPIVEEVSSSAIHNCRIVKREIWVTMNIGTLVIGEEECLDAFIWNYDSRLYYVDLSRWSIWTKKYDYVVMMKVDREIHVVRGWSSPNTPWKVRLTWKVIIPKSMQGCIVWKCGHGHSHIELNFN